MNNLFPIVFKREQSHSFGVKFNSKIHSKIPSNFYENPEQLPARDKKHDISVVLDLDLTLINAEEMNKAFAIRPYLIQFLNYLKTLNIEVIVWTAASDLHAVYIVNSLEEISDLKVDHVIYTNKKTSRFEKCLEDLNRDMKTVIHLDDNLYVCRNNFENVIVVHRFIPFKYRATSDATLYYASNIIHNVVNEYRSNDRSVSETLKNHALLKPTKYHSTNKTYYIIGS